MVIPLKAILESDIDEALLRKALSRFKCEKDFDVQNFLQINAIPFEKDNQASTYLSIDDKSGKIKGYFSLALKAFKFSSSIPKRRRKTISGKSDETIPAYLIGQLARDDSTEKGVGKELLQQAIQLIKNAQYYVGGKLVYLDCKDCMIKYYERHGFKFLQKNSNVDTLNQMYIII